MKDKRIFKASERDAYATGYIVDLGLPDVVNPDCFWHFSKLSDAKRFLAAHDRFNQLCEEHEIDPKTFERVTKVDDEQ